MHPHTTEGTTDDRRHSDIDEYGDATKRAEHQVDESRHGEHDAGYADTDRDGTPDYAERGADQDVAARHGGQDLDRDGTPDYAERGADQDLAARHGGQDLDRDGTPDYAERGVDQDLAARRGGQDLDRDGTPDYAERSDELAPEPAYAGQPHPGAATWDQQVAPGQPTDQLSGEPAVATERPPQHDDDWQLFDREHATSLRTRWTELQGSFVDDPHHALQEAEALVSEVVQSLTDRFNERKAALRMQDSADTEELRLAMRRYRTFFQQLTGG